MMPTVIIHNRSQSPVEAERHSKTGSIGRQTAGEDMPSLSGPGDRGKPGIVKRKDIVESLCVGWLSARKDMMRPIARHPKVLPSHESPEGFRMLHPRHRRWSIYVVVSLR